ncbi:two-component system activity regulator YycH [Hutsoniella sourekii]
MKMNRFVTGLLVLVVSLSVFLTYVLLYGIENFRAILNQSDQQQTAMINDVNSPSEFYQSTSLTFEDTVKPTDLIVSKDGYIAKTTQQELLDQTLAHLSPTVLKIEDEKPTEDWDFIASLYQGDFVQFIFADEYYLGNLTQLFNMDESLQASEYRVDRLIIPTGGTHPQGTAYLINSEKDSYFTLRGYDDSDWLGQLQAIQPQDEPFIEAVGAWTANRMVYLPAQTLDEKTETYTLESLPDNLYLSKVFPQSDYRLSEFSDGSTIYRAYDLTLTLDNLTQRMELKYSLGSEKSQTRLPHEKIAYTFDPVAMHEYWPGQLRISSQSSTIVHYRRYLDGLPIYAAKSIPDYGTDRIYTRSDDAGGDIARFQIPTLIIRTHIPDLSQPVKLESAQEIDDFLAEHGFALETFDDVFLAFEWQKEMHDNKSATFVPKWFFEYKGQVYSWDQIENQEFRQKYDEINQGRGNQGGDD